MIATTDNIARLRVLHVRTVNGAGGGPDKTVMKSCQFLSRLGCVAEAFYLLDRRNDRGMVQRAAAEMGVQLHCVHERGPVWPGSVRTLHRVLKEGRFDVVHSHDYKSNALLRLLRTICGGQYRLVTTVHGYNRTTLREALYYRLDRMLLKGFDAVVAPSCSLGQQLVRTGLPPQKLYVIHNGVEVDSRAGFEARQRRRRTSLLYLGRLSKEKDPVNLLQAVSILLQAGLHVQVTLAGDGPERGAIAQLARQLQLDGRVRLSGHVADVMPLLREADILVNPSRTECMPNAILEAMAAGVPVVATDVGGVAELIRHGIDGLLCPPGDPEALAEAIRSLIRDPHLANSLADSALRRVRRHFTFDGRMDSVLALYSRLLEQRALEPA